VIFSSLLLIETIRRRAGLRRTFSIHRHPLTSNTLQPHQQTREKSPTMNRNILTRTATVAAFSAPASNKIDKDILKHASRIRRVSPSKDYSTKSPRKDTSPTADSSTKRNSINKPLKSISLVSCYNITRIFVYFLSFPDEYDKYQWRESSN